MIVDKLLRQAGAVPYIVIEGEVRILLITSRETGRWLVPKGDVPRGISAAKAALKEAFEEAGVVGTLAATPLGFYTYLKKLKSGKSRGAVVELYALRVERQLKNWPEKGQRKARWVPAAEAASLVDEPGLRDLLVRMIDMLTAEAEAPAVTLAS